LANSWHWLDVALGLALVVVCFNASRRGFVREAGTLLGIGVGLVVAGRLALPLADLLLERFGRLPLVDELAYVTVVGLVAAGASVGAGFVRSTLKLPGLPVADRLAGLALGVLEGSAGLGLLLLIATRLGLIGSGARALDGSTLAPVLVNWWLAVAAVLPAELGAPRAL